MTSFIRLARLRITLRTSSGTGNKVQSIQLGNHRLCVQILPRNFQHQFTCKNSQSLAQPFSSFERPSVLSVWTDGWLQWAGVLCVEVSLGEKSGLLFLFTKRSQKANTPKSLQASIKFSRDFWCPKILNTSAMHAASITAHMKTHMNAVCLSGKQPQQLAQQNVIFQSSFESMPV